MRKFNLTIATLKEWFRIYNEKYFCGELPEWELIIKPNCSSYFGKCFYRNHRIIISTYYDREEFGFQNTLIHEMIHEWQYINKLSLGHGIDFKRKAKEINIDGWKIQRCSADDSKPLVKKQPKKVRELVTILTYNRYGGTPKFALIANSRKDYILNWVKDNSNQFQNCEIITAYYEPFNRMGLRKSVTRLSSYNFDAYDDTIFYATIKVEPLAA